MPWCEDCAKFWTPSSMPVDGSCPTCGRTLATPAGESERKVAEDPPTAPGKLDLKKLAGEDAKAPWHFKVLMVALAIYLGWRLVQLVMLIA